MKKQSDNYCWRCERVTRSRFSMSKKLTLPLHQRIGLVECKECDVIKWEGRMTQRKGVSE